MYCDFYKVKIKVLSNHNLHLSVVIPTYAKSENTLFIVPDFEKRFLVPSGFDRQIFTILFFPAFMKGHVAYETENPQDLWDILLWLED